MNEFERKKSLAVNKIILKFLSKTKFIVGKIVKTKNTR